MANDPSQNVHGDLLPHVHLLSTNRYPLMPRLDLQEVTKWLLATPRIARDTAPFFWTYLETPPDGSIYLTWQPLARRGTEFATDGYVWASAETYYRQDVGNGLVLEIFFQRSGYRMGEPAAVHSRRRFRLVPPQVAAPPNTLQVDPSLWIVHYGPAEKNDRLPVQVIPVTSQMQQTLNFRQHLLSMGQIVRKDFMLSDRVNWPQIPLPGRSNSMYAPPVNARGVPQAMAYPPQGPAPVAPTPKRRGVQSVAQQPQGHQQPVPGAMASLEGAFDDEEDTSRGDLFDHLTPREVSIARYQQNHEWMEELLSSPYRIQQIIAPDLGLGLKGELRSLTDGIFDAQGVEAHNETPKKPYVGHLDPGLAADFRKRVKDKIDTTNSEIENMKNEHAKAIADLKSGTVLRDAEADLRLCVQETGPEVWRLEGRLEYGEDVAGSMHGSNKAIEDILAQVKGSLGKHPRTVHDAERIQEGGYQEPLPEPEPVPQVQQNVAEPSDISAEAPVPQQLSQSGSPNSGIMVGDSDVDMGGPAAGLLDQMDAGFSSTSTPVNNSATPQAHVSTVNSTVATPANLNVPSPQPDQSTSALPAAPGPNTEDAEMEEADTRKPDASLVPDQGTGSGEWVMVPKTEGAGDSGQDLSVSSNTPQPQMASDAGPAKAQLQPSSKPASAAPTPSDGMAFDADNNDFSSLGDLDTAGDALASYDGSGAELGEGLDLNMDMEDSAFGDAFHGVNQSAGNTPGNGGM